jgi:hypothetical protein
LLIGHPGVGKSHAAIAIAVGAIRRGYRVLLRSAFDLSQDFAEAEAVGERRDFVQRLCRVDLLILEDFGMKKLRAPAAEDLLEVFVRRQSSLRTDPPRTGRSFSKMCPPLPPSSTDSYPISSSSPCEVRATDSATTDPPPRKETTPNEASSSVRIAQERLSRHNPYLGYPSRRRGMFRKKTLPERLWKLT